ncbi:fumarate hydratase [Bordetella hinzii]|uniref:Fumarate hydratase n=1 Tax=Bordetella hinzii TaxID=103855 RepID=A0AAN1S053_9BORD|nr:fumarate hydratase [Bordetella hinzii]AKQ55026.1 L(+)-tartrate dehydratase subunit alpha [Bordetella hinzii]AKQ59536.1 L(+)-tartrate dehydratase subunit alpha [Bordetella hinzii]AZW19322.1 fumarate hydratase [Bordetella hinzii]KCB33870.1 fumarate hydratase [Bordetella hinzii L60]KCB44653.1 fumarate hydratase [Bordetella hinzii 4161]
MRQIHTDQITDCIATLCIEACRKLPDDVLAAFERARQTEISPLGKSVLVKLIDNDRIARENDVSYCHDTGLAIVYVDVGQDVRIVGGDYQQAVHAGVRKGYAEGYLRKSVVGDPLLRVNTNDNTPAVIHTDIVPGDQIRITVLPKGGGSENWSTMKFLLPGEGVEGVKRFVLNAIEAAGGAACPPLTVGVGLGGSFDKVTEIAKKAILRDIGQHHEAPHIAALETELLEAINRSGIGPQGYGGSSTALWVAVETYACHITALPVAVNIQCHASRRKTAIL